MNFKSGKQKGEICGCYSYGTEILPPTRTTTLVVPPQWPDMYLEALHLETGKPKIDLSAKMPVPIIKATISKNKKK